MTPRCDRTAPRRPLSQGIGMLVLGRSVEPAASSIRPSSTRGTCARSVRGVAGGAKASSAPRFGARGSGPPPAAAASRLSLIHI
eukprot:9326673-Alexandrium_andersonii.AAC.1